MSNFKIESSQFKTIKFKQEEVELLELHPLCSAFPEMNQEEYDSLVSSMEEQGFLATDPIIIYNTSDGVKDDNYQILDGRNRNTASLDANVSPLFIEYIGKDPAGLVLSRNMDRRHLSSGQKAAVASKIANASAGQNQFDLGESTTREEAAKVLQTTTKAIQRFRYVQKHNEALSEEVAAGDVTLGEAERVVKQQIALNHKADKDSSPILDVESSPRSVLASEGGTATLVSTPSLDTKKEMNQPARDMSTTHDIHARDAGELRDAIFNKFKERKMDNNVLRELIKEAFITGMEYEAFKEKEEG